MQGFNKHFMTKVYNKLPVKEWERDQPLIRVFLEKIQKRYYEIINSGELDEILRKGAEEVNTLARDKFDKMKKCGKL